MQCNYINAMQFYQCNDECINDKPMMLTCLGMHRSVPDCFWGNNAIAMRGQQQWRNCQGYNRRGNNSKDRYTHIRT